nr:hypothetical protein [candidate division Zixibacteria bacterium]
MMMVQIVSYISFLVAIIAMVVKTMRYINAPEGLRWELYPVPHEKGRSDYGGSYLEELDWWTKPRHSDMFNELKEMAEEIILFKGVWRNNLKVWLFSFPFHFGLYLSIGWLALLLLGGILQAAGMAIGNTAGFLGVLIHYATLITGYAGLILAGFGALGLLVWRLTDKGQRAYNSPMEYFNLLAFDVVVAIALIAQFSTDPGFLAVRSYMQSLVTFSTPIVTGGWLKAEIIAVSLMIMYIPLTRMSHFVAKYFLYHAVRWNDKPNERGSRLEKSLVKMLNQKVGWSAPHVKTGKSWAEVVTEAKDEQ